MFTPPSMFGLDSDAFARYRITTAFIEYLIAARFAYPHTLLTAYVAAYGGVEPADGPFRVSKAVRHHCDYMVLHLVAYEPYEQLKRGNAIHQRQR